MRDMPNTPMVPSSTNPLAKNRKPSGSRKTAQTSNADLANELGMNPWDQKEPLKEHMAMRQASLNRLRQAHGLVKESKITLDDQPKKSSDLDDDMIGSSSTAFSKRTGAETAKGMGNTDPWSKKKIGKHEDLLARPATEFIKSETHEIHVPGAKKKPSKLKPLHGNPKSGKRQEKEKTWTNIAEKFINEDEAEAAVILAAKHEEMRKINDEMDDFLNVAGGGFSNIQTLNDAFEGKDQE